jgi:hypothetical protein
VQAVSPAVAHWCKQFLLLPLVGAINFPSIAQKIQLHRIRQQIIPIIPIPSEEEITIVFG